MTDATVGRSESEAGLRAACLALLVGIAGCATSPQPELLRRYASYEVADTAGLVDVSVFSSPADAWSGSTRLHELSASAQAELVEAVAARTTSADGLLGTLGRPIGGTSVPGAPPGTVDRTRFRRRMVISAESHAARPVRTEGADWSVRPAGRISRLRVALGLDSATARFTGWDRYASRYETVDLGEMTSTRRRSLGLDLNAADHVFGDGLDRARLDAASTSILDEELPLRRRYVSTGALRPDSLVLLQEGAVGIDLTGNSVVEVEIDVVDAPSPARTFAFEGLFDGQGAPRRPDSVRVRPKEVVHAPRGTGDVVAELHFDAVVRTVRPGSGDATWAEGDDHARFLVETASAGGVVLVPGRETRASVWQLATPGCRALLHVESATRGLPAVLQLSSAGEAFELLRWLRAARVSEVGGRRLRLGPEVDLGADGIDELAVRLLPLNWELSEGGGCP